MSSRKFLVGVLVLGLLIWGPIDHSTPAWLLIRLSYLIAVPLGAWFLLGRIWNVWKPSPASEDMLERALGAASGGVFVTLAVFAATADHHWGNTMWVQTRDGLEAVGDDVIRSGPDWHTAFALFAAAGFSFWFSIRKRTPSG